jgi:hypothetical protein
MSCHIGEVASGAASDICVCDGFARTLLCLKVIRFNLKGIEDVTRSQGRHNRIGLQHSVQYFQHLLHFNKK